MAVHATLIGAAIVGSGKAMLPPREKVEQHAILYVPPPPPKVYTAPEPLPEVKKPPVAKARVAAPRPRTPPPPRRVETPTPRPVQTTVPAAPLIAPIKIPDAVPAVNLKAIPTVSEVAALPEPSRGIGSGRSAKSSSDGDVDGDGAGKRGLGSGNSGRAYSENQVERAVVPTRAPQPRYPDALKSVNVTGEVMVQYIVDERGRVEPGSIKILSSTHKLFAESVRRALLEAKYRPAEVGGHPVRQLVEQPFIFKLDQ